MGAVLARPRLWATAGRQWGLLVRGPFRAGDGGRSYLTFRAETMFGAGGGRLSAAELVGYLEWCRWARSLTR